MPVFETTEYYQTRMLAAVAMSDAASEPYIARVHLELAERYSVLAGTPTPIAGDDPAISNSNDDLVGLDYVIPTT